MSASAFNVTYSKFHARSQLTLPCASAKDYIRILLTCYTVYWCHLIQVCVLQTLSKQSLKKFLIRETKWLLHITQWTSTRMQHIMQPVNEVYVYLTIPCHFSISRVLTQTSVLLTSFYFGFLLASFWFPSWTCASLTNSATETAHDVPRQLKSFIVKRWYNYLGPYCFYHWHFPIFNLWPLGSSYGSFSCSIN